MESNSWALSPSAANGIAVSSSLKIAIIKNKTYATALSGTGIYVSNPTGPVIRIDSTAVNFVKGKATPGCKIEVFLDDACWACDGEVFSGRTTLNADSSWSFTGTFNGVVVATAARSDSTTSGYTEPFYRLDSVTIIEPTCGLANGSIKGIYGFESTENVEWHKVTFDLNTTPYLKDTIVATTPDLMNMVAGDYYFVARLGQTCHSASNYYRLVDYTPVIDETYRSVTQPACGLFNGSVGNMTIKNREFSTYQWVNEQNVLLSSGDASGDTGYPYLNNLSSGKYRLIVTDNRKGCADTSSYFTLVNQSGPNLNLNNVQINYAKCGSPNGSIVGISASNITGTPFIQWTDTGGNILGNAFNLQNASVGKYTLKFKDESSCDTISTPFFEIKDSSVITINVAKRIVKAAGCTLKNGSISNIVVSNASKYIWKDMNGFTTVANTLNITGLASGFYQLTASNALGCSANSNGIYVANTTFDSIAVTNHDKKNASCNNADGRISITGYSKKPIGYTFRWIDSSSNRQIATGNIVGDLGKGVYTMLATDSNGCEQKIFREFVDSLSTPLLSFSSMLITNDVCGGKTGSITGLIVKDLIGPTVYKWFDVSNNIVGNEFDLKNVGAGEYYLLVDDVGCGIASSVKIINNDPNAGVAPEYKDLVVSKNSPAALAISNFKPGTYILFADAAGLQELQSNTTGNFTTMPMAGNYSFYVKHVTAACSSRIVKVNVTAVDNSYFTIAKVFTPNGDLINNKLTVRIVGYIKLTHFKIFNRFGQVVFETSQLNDTWDGKFKGKNLPDAAYVWIAEGTDITGKIIRDNGTVLILR